tara:strand:+ start:8005 stop:8970 length:966 start_codon:yes stop_codon:yes gene_type:complete
MFSICIFSALSSILLKMGTTVKYEDIEVRFPGLFLNVFLHQYVLDPFFALLIAIAFTPPLPHVYGMFVMALTPATAAASVSVYTVDGDVPLALALSMGSLIQSVAFTPLVFTALIKLYGLFTNHSGVGGIELPYLRMFYLMTYVLFIISIGYKLRQKGPKQIVDKIGLYCQRFSIVLMLTAIGCFIASKSFIKAFTSRNPYTQFGSIIILIYGQLILAHIPICNLESKKKDTSVFVTIRRSPGIALAIAAISFNNYDNYGEVIGYVLVYGMIRDWATLPYNLILRKKRLGHYLFSSVKAERQNQLTSSTQDEIPLETMESG